MYNFLSNFARCRSHWLPDSGKSASGNFLYLLISGCLLTLEEECRTVDLGTSSSQPIEFIAAHWTHMDSPSRAASICIKHRLSEVSRRRKWSLSNEWFMAKRPPRILLICLFLSQPTLSQRSSTGLVPLVDLKTDSYRGYQGGLYPNGLNLRPNVHDSLGVVFSKRIGPLNAQGLADTANGKYVFLSIGMSNTTQEFSFFKALADTDRTKHPKLVIVDGAQGGQTAAIISNPDAAFWTVIEQRLQSAGVSAKQVQVCWVKEADAGPTQPFPTHAQTLFTELISVARNIKRKYPNCGIAYFSSRTYGGYATTTLNPEPYAYESGFSVKWLIERQINNDTSLVCTGENPRAPWLAWGPYLWADGVTPRSDGLIWRQEDFGSDGTHPSTSGRQKVAQLLLQFLKNDETAKRWYLKSTPTSIGDDRASDVPEEFKLSQNYPNPFNPTTTILYQLPARSGVRLSVWNVLGEEVNVLAEGLQDAGTFTVRWGDGFPSGIYFCRFEAIGIEDPTQRSVLTRKMVLVK